MTCLYCGASVMRTFCDEDCETNFKQAEYDICPNCNAEKEPDDIYCRYCMFSEELPPWCDNCGDRNGNFQITDTAHNVCGTCYNLPDIHERLEPKETDYVYKTR